MRKIKHLIVPILLLVFIFSGNSFAYTRPQRSFLPFFWIEGRVLDSPQRGGAPVPRKRVLFYLGDINRSVIAATDDEGKFRLNAYELSYYHNIPLRFGAGANQFDLAVPQDAAGFGYQGKVSLLTGKGVFSVGDLVLVKGQGPADPDDIPPIVDSTVPVNGAERVALGTAVSITFSEAMREAVNIKFNPLPPGLAPPVWSDGFRTVTYTHNGFASATPYKVTVKTAQDLAGNALAQQFAFSFTAVRELGSAPLTIERQGSDIKLSWVLADFPDPPRIFMLVGDGSGKFSNDAAGWQSIDDADLAPQFNLDHIAKGYVLHKTQVGKGHAEVYYKALQAGVAAGDILEALPQAPAVGKFNINSAIGGANYFYFSVPFTYNTNRIKDVLDPEQFDVGARVFAQLNGFNFNIAEIVENNAGKKGWVSAFDKSQKVGETFFVKPEGSYMLNAPAAKTYTVVGSVLQANAGVSIKIQGNDHPGGNSYTYFGNYYPYQIAIGDLGLGANIREGDRIFYPLDTRFNFDIAYRDDRGQWVSEFDKSQQFLKVLQPPLGYMYKRNGPSFDWAR